MVTKANVRTRVHRRAYMDYIGVKLYGEGGEVTGELRIIGLFTSMALATAAHRSAAGPPQGHRGDAPLGR